MYSTTLELTATGLLPPSVVAMANPHDNEREPNKLFRVLVPTMATSAMRGLAYGGMLPPVIAKMFTVGQAAVLTVVAWEHLHHGARRKCIAEIADGAGCSGKWVKQSSLIPNP